MTEGPPENSDSDSGGTGAAPNESPGPENREEYALSPEAPKTALPVTEKKSPPVPEKPLHLCPNCDYCLIGLTSRRCPECGEPFTLVEAKRRGEELNPPPELVRDFEVIAWERKQLMIGGGAFAVGFVVPFILSEGCVRWFLISELTIALLSTAIYRHHFPKRLPPLVFSLGLALLVINACLIAILKSLI